MVNNKQMFIACFRNKNKFKKRKLLRIIILSFNAMPELWSKAINIDNFVLIALHLEN